MQHSQWMLERRVGIASARGAKEWLRDLPLADARSAHHATQAFFDELADAGLDARTRLEILETVRGHVVEIDERYAPQYAGRPLPLGPVERNAFDHAKTLWRTLAAAYLECFEASLEAADPLAPHRALCLARAGDLFCAALRGHVRAGQSGIDDLVDDLQRLVDLAAEHVLLDTMVRDSLHPRGATSVARIYRRALLIGLAGGTFSGREREALFELAALWEGKTAYTVLPAEPGRELRREDLPPSGTGRQRLRLVRLGSWTHIVDVTRLSRSLRRRLRRLDAGEDVGAVRLPDPFRQLPARDLLARLHHLWCESADLRGTDRRPVVPAAQSVAVSHATSDFAVMYCLVAGSAFDAGGADDEARSRRRHDELFVFQQPSLARDEGRVRDATRQFEDWEVVNQSDAGFLLRRVRAGTRLKPAQLLALRLRVAGDDGLVVLAQVRWLAEPRPAGRLSPGALDAGVEILPGKPHGVGFQPDGGAHARPVAGFRLGSLHARETITVVTPRGWFEAGRVVVMRDAGLAYRLRLAGLVARGTDFEQIEAVLLAA